MPLFSHSETFTLRLHERLAYSVGHFYNDLCASMWFTYLLVYFHYLLNFDNAIIGYLLLLGQVVDAICTPFIGFESDRTAGFCGYGKRKSWHLLGTFCVTISFPFLFLQCIYCSDARQWNQFVYYAAFIVIFQFGWASVQISHMSIINQLTTVESERVELYSFRNANTLLANILVYGVAWALLGVQTDQDWNDNDIRLFMILMFIVVGCGLIFSILYHVGVKEAHDTVDQPINNSSSIAHGLRNSMTWKDWLKEHQFYLTGVLYMISRLIYNVMQTYWPILLTDMLGFEKKICAIIPMIICIAGFVTSFGMRPINRLIGRKLTFALGIVISSCGVVWIWFLSRQSAQVYGPAVIIGIGTNVLIVTSLSMTADIIGNNVRSSAFVYGIMSLTDKLSSGVALVLIQKFRPICNKALESCIEEQSLYIRYVMVILPACCLVACIIFLLIISPMKLGALRQYSRSDPAVNGGVEANADDNDDDDGRGLLQSTSVQSGDSIDSHGVQRRNYGAVVST